MPRPQKFRQFRIDKLSVEQINREFDLVRQALNGGERGERGPTGATGPEGPQGPAGAAGTGGWQLALSYGWYTGLGALPASEGPGVLWLKPYSWVDNCIVYSEPIADAHGPAEWSVDGTYTQARIDVFINDLIVVPSGGTIDFEITKNNGPVGIGIFGQTSGSGGNLSDSGSLSVTSSDRIGVVVRYVGAFTWSPAGYLHCTVKVSLS